MRKLSFGLALLALFVLPAFAHGQEPTGDLARLQGKWVTAMKTRSGTITMFLEFKGNLVTTVSGTDPNAPPDAQQEVRLDETTTPKSIDLVNGKWLNVEKGSLKEKIGVPDMYASYELNGDTLKLAMSPVSRNRPKSFQSSLDASLVVYTRGTTPAVIDMTARPKAAVAKPARPALAGDLALLQGTWRNQSGHLNSERETLTIRDDVLLASSKLPRGGEVRFESRIQLDESASPKTIDFVSPHVGKKTLQTAYGIYELDGDTLKIHKSGIGRGRSSVFQNGSEQGSVSIWTRAGSRARSAAPAPVAAAAAKEPKPQYDHSNLGPQTYRGAKIVRVMPRRLVISVEGKEHTLGPFVHATKGFDAQGKALPAGQATRLAWEGNIVDVTTRPALHGSTFPSLTEIRLIEGQVGAPNPATGLKSSR
jgi:uncharacterized protein (TIGR03067 family)